MIKGCWFVAAAGSDGGGSGAHPADAPRRVNCRRYPTGTVVLGSSYGIHHRPTCKARCVIGFGYRRCFSKALAAPRVCAYRHLPFIALLCSGLAARLMAGFNPKLSNRNIISVIRQSGNRYIAPLCVSDMALPTWKLDTVDQGIDTESKQMIWQMIILEEIISSWIYFKIRNHRYQVLPECSMHALETLHQNKMTMSSATMSSHHYKGPASQFLAIINYFLWNPSWCKTSISSGVGVSFHQLHQLSPGFQPLLMIYFECFSDILPVRR